MIDGMEAADESDIGWCQAELAALDVLADAPSRGEGDYLAGLIQLHKRAEAALGPTHRATLALLAEAAAAAARAPWSRRPGEGPRFPDTLPSAVTSPAGLDALAARVAATRSARVRARLADILWESGSRDHRRAALAAPAAYLDFVRVLRGGAPTAGRDLEIADALRRAGELAVATGQTELAETVLAETVDGLERALAERKLGTVIEMAITIDGLRSRLTLTQAQAVLGQLRVAVELFRPDGPTPPPFALAELHELRRRLLLTLRREADARAEDLAAATEFADFAARAGGGLVAQGYLDAAIHYAERGQADRRVLNGYRAGRRQALKAGLTEMKPIVTSHTLPTPLSQALQAHRQALVGLPVTEVLRHLARSFLLTEEQCAKTAEWAATNTPFVATVPRTLIAGPGSTVGPGHDPAGLFDIARLMLAASEGFLLQIWTDLRGRTDVTAADVTAHFVRTGVIPGDHEALIALGMERAWAEDYASALHILVPQLEDVLRRLLEKAGHDPMRRRPTDPQVTEEITLRPVIDGLVAAQAMSVDEAWLFQLVLDEPAGLNLRNRIAHGLVGLAELTPERFVRVLQLYCIGATVAQGIPQEAEP